MKSIGDISCSADLIITKVTPQIRVIKSRIPSAENLFIQLLIFIF